jgi:hypothetical protein
VSPANTVEGQQDSRATHVPQSSGSADRSAQLALLAFVAVLGVGLVLSLVFGHSQWFFLDDWDFLADRRATDLGDLLRPHNEHWMTIPVLVYRMLFRLFGLRTYVPYQLVLILLHLTAAVLLRTVMRRAGVGPWIATAAASIFVLFGAGDESILFAPNIGFVGALVLGLTQLLLADHDGPLDGRDYLGLLAGVAGVMCSGVAVSMTIVVGLAMLMRRGWRVALFHSAPLAVIYVAWWLAFARGRYATATTSIELVARFVSTGFAEAYDEMGQVPGVGLALGLLLAAGLVFAWRGLDRVELGRRAAAPAAMLVGSVIFLTVTGIGRGIFGPDAARAGRYLHLVTALSLPAIAVAADALVRRSRLLGTVAVALLLVGVPGNVGLLVDHDARAKFTLGTPDLVLPLPRVAMADRVPRRLRPLPDSAPKVTIGWLLDGAAAGRIPDPGRISPLARATATLRLSFLQARRPTTRSACRALREPVTRTLQQNQVIRIDGGRLRISAPENDLIAATYTPSAGHALVAVGGPLSVIMRSADPVGMLAVVCA